MNPFIAQVVIQTVLKNKAKVDDPITISNYALAKGYKQLRTTIKQSIKDIFLIVLGIFSAAFGFKGFLLTNHFIDGGATGISLLISAITPIPLYVLIIIINIPFIILGYTVISRNFAIKTSLSILLLAIVLLTVRFPNITDDNLLVAVFGGFFLGAGIGFAIRGGAVIDGTEVLAIYLSRKMGATVGDIIVFINIIIFGVAAYFLGIEIALYSMITYLAASKTLDFIVEGIEEYIGVTIISSHQEEIRKLIVSELNHGITIYDGKQGHGKGGEKKQVDILFTVITRLELNKLKKEIEKIDPNAFMIMNSVKDIKGGIIKKRPLQH